MGSRGHSIGHESISQAPTGLEGGLEPLWLEKLGPHRPGIVRAGPSARAVWLAASINSTPAESSWQRHQRVWVGLGPRAPPLGRSLCQLSYLNPRLKKKIIIIIIIIMA